MPRRLADGKFAPISGTDIELETVVTMWFFPPKLRGPVTKDLLRSLDQQVR